MPTAIVVLSLVITLSASLWLTEKVTGHVPVTGQNARHRDYSDVTRSEGVNSRGNPASWMRGQLGGIADCLIDNLVGRSEAVTRYQQQIAWVPHVPGSDMQAFG
jgi:hypothetical protein